MNTHRKIMIFGFLFILALLAGLFYLNYKGQGTKPEQNLIKDTSDFYATADLSIGQSNISVQIADTPEMRSLGLGDRTSLGANQGMLFVFDHPDRYGFWMKDTLIPLDMIWINKDKVIVSIKNSVSPSTFPEVFYPSAPSLYVLEVNAGYAESHGIKTGMPAKF